MPAKTLPEAIPLAPRKLRGWGNVRFFVALLQPSPDLLRRAQLGDERAFAEIVRVYEGTVYDYVRRLVNDRSLAEELTQEVFLSVFRGLPKFSGRCRFTSWLFQVAKNRVYDELRRSIRRLETVTLEAGPELHANDPEPEQGETIEALWRAVAKLTPGLKSPLLLRDVVGLSYAEIAEALELELATVKWRIYRARELVQRELGRQGIAFGAPKAAAEHVPAPIVQPA
jgi:RNA polymerase sigma-70 factor (ECF subfamily)